VKRSSQISLQLVPIVAAAFLSACGAPQRRTCVDENGRVAADNNCAGQPPSGAGASWDTRPRTGPSSHYYHWYWYRGSSPVIGNYAPHGGSFAGPSVSGTTRGGFGSTAAGHSAGGS
jgi:hypothetical protein